MAVHSLSQVYLHMYLDEGEFQIWIYIALSYFSACF